MISYILKKQFEIIFKLNCTFLGELQFVICIGANIKKILSCLTFVLFVLDY